MIQLQNVDAGYPGSVILENVSFDVFKGEIFGLLGTSGCGKSTLMRHMIGLNPVLGGNVRIAGLEWDFDTRAELCKKIGVMYQSGALFGSMTCLENVMLPMKELADLKRKARSERPMELLKSVGLEDSAGKMPFEIYVGMRKSVALARAMALDPEVVFLDEPSAGLDPIVSSELDDLILRLRQDGGTTFVIVTNELESVFKIVDRCAVFDRERRGLGGRGVPQELKLKTQDAFVKRFFNRGGV